MPIGLLARLPVGQVEAILVHELAHIRATITWRITCSEW